MSTQNTPKPTTGKTVGTLYEDAIKSIDDALDSCKAEHTASWKKSVQALRNIPISDSSEDSTYSYSTAKLFYSYAASIENNAPSYVIKKAWQALERKVGSFYFGKPKRSNLDYVRR